MGATQPECRTLHGNPAPSDNPTPTDATKHACRVARCDTPKVISRFWVAAGRVVVNAGPMADQGPGLAGFDAMSDDAAHQALLACCSSPGLARSLVVGRPYPSVEALLDAADAAVARLPESEIDLALAGHFRIGERPRSADSAREQAGVAAAADEVREALAEGNRTYEERFGHIYLVCATGKSAEEVLALLTARLRNDPETERRVVRTELAKINRIRLRGLLEDRR